MYKLFLIKSPLEILYVLLPQSMLLGLLQNVDGCMSGPPKVVYFWRVRHGCSLIVGESDQLKPQSNISNSMEDIKHVFHHIQHWNITKQKRVCCTSGIKCCSKALHLEKKFKKLPFKTNELTIPSRKNKSFMPEQW